MILVKYIIQISEMHFYKEDYPQVVKYEVIINSIICWAMVVVEGILIFKLRIFKACKAAYAFKLVKIIFIFYEAFLKDELIQDQCSKWLSNPIHKF